MNMFVLRGSLEFFYVHAKFELPINTQVECSSKADQGWIILGIDSSIYEPIC